VTEPFVLAHLSDPHLGPMPPPRMLDLIGKRALGYANWKRKRHAIHRREVLAELIADLHAQHPDHIAVTGDLVNVALPAEFEEARDWLTSVGSPDDVSLVPGNHDAYAISTRRHHLAMWANYMRGDTGSAIVFPYLRRRGPLALIGLTTAVPTAPFMATGRIGDQQIAALDRLLARLATENLCRVLLLHHPLRSARGRWTARLTDAGAVIEVLKHRGIDLVLHGHDHRHAVAWIDALRGRIPTIGVPSASASCGGHHQPAAYQLLSISGDNTNTWRIARRVRGFTNAAPSNSIVQLQNEQLI
jgi:3',5'-cyclic AMP phosphodiesterase CpdA